MGLQELQLSLAVLYAASNGLGFDPGIGTEIKLESRYFEISASATTERKHEAESGYTWGGAALLMYPIKDMRFFGGATVYGYETDDWKKQATSPIIGAEYRGKKLRVRLDHQFENEHNDEVTSLGFEVAMTTKWWFGMGGGITGQDRVADLRLTFRP